MQNSKQNKVKTPTYDKQIGNLNRITGQIEGIKKMITSDRYCVDILTQLKAARSAIKSIENTILDAHLNYCVKNAIQEKDNEQTKLKIEEVLSLLKNFN